VSPNEQQIFTLMLAVLITLAVLALDSLLWWGLGVHLTFSRAFDWLFRRWPICAAMLFLWIGVLVGHLLPANP